MPRRPSKGFSFCEMEQETVCGPLPKDGNFLLVINDFAGVTEKIWTRDSINCRRLILAPPT